MFTKAPTVSNTQCVDREHCGLNNSYFIQIVPNEFTYIVDMVQSCGQFKLKVKGSYHFSFLL